MSLEISPEAREEAANAVRFYNAKPGRHGSAFEAELGRAVVTIASNPRLYPLSRTACPIARSVSSSSSGSSNE